MDANRRSVGKTWMRQLPRIAERRFAIREWGCDPGMFEVVRFEVEVTADHCRRRPVRWREGRAGFFCIRARRPRMPAGLFMQLPQCLHLSHPLQR